MFQHSRACVFQEAPQRTVAMNGAAFARQARTGAPCDGLAARPCHNIPVATPRVRARWACLPLSKWPIAACDQDGVANVFSRARGERRRAASSFNGPRVTEMQACEPPFQCKLPWGWTKPDGAERISGKSRCACASTAASNPVLRNFPYWTPEFARLGSAPLTQRALVMSRAGSSKGR